MNRFLDDLNQVKQVFEEAGERWELDAACRGMNQEMVEAVNQYKLEEMNWYNRQAELENGYTSTTQGLWYTHYLQKKRAKQLGIKIHYEYNKPTKYPKGERDRYPLISYEHDGKNLICKISDRLRYRKVFYAQNASKV